MLLPKDFAGHKGRACKIACQGTMESGSSSMSSFFLHFCALCFYAQKTMKNMLTTMFYGKTDVGA
jgi:hypothetical protein